MTGKELEKSPEMRTKVLARTLDYLRRGEYDRMIRPLLAAEYGISTQLAGKMLEIARRVILRQYFGNEARGPILNALAVLDGFITDAECPPAVRLAAQIEKDRIFGLHHPARIETTGEIVHRVEVVFTGDWRPSCDFDLGGEVKDVEVGIDRN